MRASLKKLYRSRSVEPPKSEFWDRNQKFRYLMMAEIAQRVVDDPNLIKAGEKYLEAHMAANPQVEEHYSRWKSLLQRPANELARRWLADTDEGEYLRANPPLFLVVDTATRERISAEATAWANKRADRS